MQTAILIGGLTVGMLSCILLLQYVSYELSFDQFHSKKDHIYRVVNERFQAGKSVQKGTITYPTIGPTLKEEYPEIANYTRIAYSPDLILQKGDRIETVTPGLSVDQHFFELFDFPLMAREGIQILDEPNEVVLSKNLADRFFPALQGNYNDLIGEGIHIDEYEDVFKIVGVCENIPSNSHLQFEILVSYESVVRYWGEGADNSWTWSDFYHYVQLVPETNVEAFEVKLKDFSQRHFRGTEVSGSEEVFTLQALNKVHLYSNKLEYDIANTTNGRAVWSLLIIAFFILLLAWVNYVNLSSVRAIERAKEVGIRKVVGATRGQLIRQFLMEAICINALSLMLAFAFAQALLPSVASNFDLDQTALNFLNPAVDSFYLLLALFGFILLGVLVSAAYPAWLLSSTHVSSVLKGIFQKDTKSAWLRKGLVVFQFTISIALITATAFVSKQISFMSQQDLGIQVDQVMRVNSPELSVWDSTFIDRMNTFKKALQKFPGVESAATSSRTPGERMGRIFQIQRLDDGNREQLFTSNFMDTDFEYAKTYGLKPLSGRFFREEDHNYNFNLIDKVVITEAAVEMLGYSNNEHALNKRIRFWNKEWQIVGVMPNFHQRSLHHAVEPILFLPSYSTNNELSIRLTTSNLDQTIDQIRMSYAQFFPGNDFNYHFVDDQFQTLYTADIRFGRVLSLFSLLTILIACLGLFGLSSYLSFLRTKEIGIRRILGASLSSIVHLLSKDFLRLVVIAFVLAVPLAYFFLERWLRNFSYQTELSIWFFVLAGLLALVITFLTVGTHSLKVALANPADAVKAD